MEKEWRVYTKRADFNALSESLGIDKITARILVNRGISEEDMPSFLNPSKADFNDPHMLYDMDKSVDIIVNAINDNKHIRIIGDYDIDGICATFILRRCIEEVGGSASYYLPKRIEDGYGMNEDIVRRAKADGVDLIITCDNGISALDSVALAKELGITVVVTDHHEVIIDEDGEEVLPKADAVIDPKRADCVYPFKEICGAVVAWKLAFCLYEAFGMDEKYAMEYLEFAAFATVGDIMQLRDENRSIVSLGLQKMAHTKNTGLRTLIECCGLNGHKIASFRVGYNLGPCLNAGGRLSDASIGVELFETDDPIRAKSLAEELINLNEDRKQMTADGVEAAIDVIEKNGYGRDQVIVVYVPHVHESLCGIIAGRLKERYARPCFMLTDAEYGIKGSGRSVEGYPMVEKMREVRDLFIRFGGHPMAAGLSIEKQNLEPLRRGLNANSGLLPEDLSEKVFIDVPMPISYISSDLVKELDLLEPHGNGNEKPVFGQKNVQVQRIRRVGDDSSHAKLYLRDEAGAVEAMFYKNAEEFCSRVNQGDYIDIIYYPKINYFRGEESVQIVIKDYQLSKAN